MKFTARLEEIHCITSLHFMPDNDLRGAIFDCFRQTADRFFPIVNGVKDKVHY